MPSQIYTILGIILFCGILGGLVSAFITDEQPLSRALCGKRVVIGIGCAFLVPLFLNMISSTLIEKSETSPKDYFVFGPRNFLSVKVFRMDLEADFKRLFVVGFGC